MKKVLLAFDGDHLSNHLIEFLRQMHKHQPVFATGLFLPAVDYSELLYSLSENPTGPLYITDIMPESRERVKNNIRAFKKICHEYNIPWAVHENDTTHIIELIRNESRFADLLLIDGKSFYENMGQDVQHDYIKNVLHKSECPVMIIPEDVSEPQNLIFAYDGTEQSVFALKQFNHLFPNYAGRQACLVFFSGKEINLPQRENIEELLACHYENFVITSLNVHKKAEIEGWLLQNNNPVFITGSYGRSMLSEFFRPSFSSHITASNRFLVFIAHK